MIQSKRIFFEKKSEKTTILGVFHGFTICPEMSSGNML